jgi:hypothetical protein
VAHPYANESGENGRKLHRCGKITFFVIVLLKMICLTAFSRTFFTENRLFLIISKLGMSETVSHPRGNAVKRQVKESKKKKVATLSSHLTGPRALMERANSCSSWFS